MRLPRLSQRQENILGATLCIILSPALLILAAAILLAVGSLWSKRALLGPRRHWARWFAWHPVNLGTWYEPDRRWLEVVERQSWGIGSDINYRAAVNAGLEPS